MKPTVKWVFAASLAANIFLIGLVVGRVFPPMPPRPPAPPHESLAKLPAEKREAVEQMMERMKQRRDENRKTMDGKRAEVIAILEAPEFDEAAFVAKSKEMDGVFAGGKQQMMLEMAELAKGFSQPERKVLAGQLRRPPPPPPPGKDGPPPPPPGEAP